MALPMTRADPNDAPDLALLAAVVRRRQRCDAMAHAVGWLLVLALVALTLLVVHRAVPVRIDIARSVPLWAVALGIVAALPLLALALGRVTRPATGLADAARTVDAACGTRDLFLTRVHLDASPGTFAPLVRRDAGRQATGIDARTIDVGTPWRRAPQALGALAVLVAAVAWLPGAAARPDPAGRTATQAASMAEHRDLAVKRVAALRKREVSAELSPQVAALLAEMKQALRALRPDAAEANEAGIRQQQQRLGEKWRDARAASVRRTGGEGVQSLGARTSQQARELRRELGSGRTDSARSKLESARALAKRWREQGDEQTREQLRDQLAQALGALRDGASAASPELQQAFARLAQQLQTMARDGTSPEAERAFDATMDLAALELERWAQTARDLDALERALDTLQLARALNEIDPLDGAACQECESVADYAELYRKMVADAAGHACAECRQKGLGACAGDG